MLFMFLYPLIFNGNAVEASSALGIPRSTLLGWTSCSVKKNFVNKWYDLVAKLTWGEVRKHFSSEIVAKYSKIEDESTIDVTKYRELKGDNVILSKFCGLPPAKRAKLAKKSSQAKARGVKPIGGMFSLVNQGDKMQIKSRAPKYQEMPKSITEFILQGWYTGTPFTRQGCYQTVIELSEKGSDF